MKGYYLSACKLYILCGILCLLTSCREYDAFVAEEVFRHEYQSAFEKVFGEVDPEQDWDFSSCCKTASSYGKETRSMTSSLPPYVYDPSAKLAFEAGKELLSEIHEKNTSREMGRSFAFLIDGDDRFDIYPLYQLNQQMCGFIWSLKVFVDGKNVEFASSTAGWAMGTGMYAMDRNNNYGNVILDKGTCTEYGIKSSPLAKYSQTDGKERWMYINLNISDYVKTTSNSRYACKGSQQSCLHHQMRILDVSRPENVGDEYETIFVACESADFQEGIEVPFNNGKRYQTLVMMIIGPKGHLPDVVYLSDDSDRLKLSTVTDSKRYMIEDLGSVSDFDFNDIVLDVEHKVTSQVNVSQTPKEGKAPLTSVGVEMVSTSDVAVLRHLCGTIPFELTFEGKTFPKIEQPMEAELPIVMPLEHWNQEENNIRVTVWPHNQGDGEEWTISFPGKGEVPYIMALPVTEGWTAEGVTFTGWKEYLINPR